MLSALLALASFLPPQGASFEFASPQGTATILVPASEPECVLLAAGDLAGDVERITGRRPEIVRRLDACGAQAVVLATAAEPRSAKLLARFLPDASNALKDKWEVWRVRTVQVTVGPIRNALVIAGSDERGTMFGLYAFCEERLGVDPMHFWAGRPPPQRQRLAWEEVRLDGEEPTFRYRGWFINDEDLLTEWFDDGGQRDIAYPYYHQVTSPRATRHIFEAALRLRYNLIIPASFIDIRNPAEERLVADAARRGLFVSQHHIEPLGVSGYGFANYWRDQGEDVPFSFVRHRDRFETVWREYAKRWAKYCPRVVWQLGLRGVADRPVWASDPAVPKSAEARGRIISQAMALQWRIVREVDPRPKPPATTTLWMEGSSLHAAGHLTFPPGVAVIFADNSPGWRLQRDFHTVKRQPGRPYGVYYHQQLWGSGPHLVQGVSPQRMHGVFTEVVERGSTHYAIFNVGNVREFVLGVAAGAEMLRDFEGFDPDRFLSEWCRERFGPAAEAAERAYRRHFASFVRDPETGARGLLDGETLHRGRRFLRAMADRVKEGRQRPWNQPERVFALLVQVQKQRAAAERAGAEIPAILDKLDGAGRRFFEANFVAQHRILTGLLGWLEHSLLAGLSLQGRDAGAALVHLRSAQESFARIRSGQALASRGERWRHWYRGDRKMNLGRAEALTRDAVELLEAHAAD